MKIGIIVAMDKELKQLQTLFNDEQVRVEKCGIGKVPFISFRVISDIPPRDTDAMKDKGSATEGMELGTYTVEDMRRLTIACLQWIMTQTEVPATQPESCGNYLLHDLPMCKWESARYLDRLQNDFHCEYTKLQITLGDGRVFADA